MHPSNTLFFGTKSAVGTAGQTVATTKYSVGTAVRNKYGERWCRVIIKTTQPGVLYFYGHDESFASVANTGPSAGTFIDSETIAAPTALDGTAYWFPCVAFAYILPVFYQASGSDATVSHDVATFND
jgi:hypothetical protein